MRPGRSAATPTASCCRASADPRVARVASGSLEDAHRGRVVAIRRCGDATQAEPVGGRLQQHARSGRPDASAAEPRIDDVADQSVGALGAAGLTRPVHDVEEAHRHHLVLALGDARELRQRLRHSQPLTTQLVGVDVGADHPVVDPWVVAERQQRLDVGLDSLAEQQVVDADGPRRLKPVSASPSSAGRHRASRVRRGCPRGW